MSRLVIMSSLAFAHVLGCASNVQQIELSRLRQELLTLQEKIGASDRRIKALEGELSELRTDGSLASRTAAPARGESVQGDRVAQQSRTSRRLSGPPRGLPVVKVGATDRMAHVDETLGAVDHGEPPVLIRVRGAASDRLTVDHDVLSKPDPVLDKPIVGAEESYRRALNKLRKDNDPGKALVMFRAFLKKNPEHHLADNALYWSGEAHQVLVQHQRAIEVFRRLLESFPRSNKVSWAKLRMAESYLTLGEVEAGRALLARLRTEHPKSEPARLAGARLAALATVDR